jgi:hypothetical protein
VLSVCLVVGALAAADTCHAAATGTPVTLPDNSEHTAQRSSLSGVVLLLPASYPAAALSPDDAAALLRLERQLLQQQSVVPVFFAADSPQLAAAMADTRAAFAKGVPPSQHSDRWQVRIQG